MRVINNQKKRRPLRNGCDKKKNKIRKSHMFYLRLLAVYERSLSVIRATLFIS